jgi:competence protein ComGC
MNKEDGFTIIELLIASIAFTVLLILVTMIVIQVSRVYYKGVVLSNTQNVNSTIVQDVSKNVQFDPGSSQFKITSGIINNVNYYCIGSSVFIYNLGQEFNLSSSNIGLIYETGNTTCPISSRGINTLNNYLAQGFKELLSPMMRVVYFKVKVPQLSTSPLYNISIGVAFGSNQSLCNTSNSCSSPTTMNTSNYSGSNVRCKLQQGDQYCGISYLYTTVANEYNLN